MIGVDRTAAAAARGFSEDALLEMSRALGEPEWLLERRLDARRTYERMPMPSRKEEDWRRTDLSMLDLDSVVPFSGWTPIPSPSRASGKGSPSLLHPRGGRAGDGGLGGLLVQHNSLNTHRELAADLAARGVILTDLESAAREHPDLVQRHLMAQLSPESGKFAALHAAFWSGGAFVYVPRNVEIELPIHILACGDRPGLGIMPHTLVVMESGARLTVVEEAASPEDTGPTLAGGGVELVLGEGSQLHYVALQRWGAGTFSLGFQKAAIHRDAQLTTLSVVLGSRMTKSWVESALLEPGAGTRMVGVMFGGGEQRFHHHTLQDHRAPNTTSDLLYKVALTGRARSEYSGMIKVQKLAAGTDAYQANRNLLLSPRARADSMPKLEIENNDVRCTHGATVGPIDEEALFYLMARGLPRSAAEQMVVEGFFEPVVAQIPLEGVRDRVRRAIDAKLSAAAR